jgi:hypothetical protein
MNKKIYYSHQEIITILKKKIGRKNQADLAYALNISPQYFSDILKGNRGISPRVARLLGFRRIIRYKKIDKEKENE